MTRGVHNHLLRVKMHCWWTSAQAEVTLKISWSSLLQPRKHCVKWMGIKKRSNLCYEIATKWISRVIPPGFGNPLYAIPQVLELWMLQDYRTPDLLVKHLAQASKQLQKQRSRNVCDVWDRTLENRVLDTALTLYEQEAETESMKQLCAACEIFVGRRHCSKCERCSVRYCSQACQVKDWDNHRAYCAKHVSKSKR